jgi:hypothetical protein
MISGEVSKLRFTLRVGRFANPQASGTLQRMGETSRMHKGKNFVKATKIATCLPLIDYRLDP